MHGYTHGKSRLGTGRVENTGERADGGELRFLRREVKGPRKQENAGRRVPQEGKAVWGLGGGGRP